MVGWLDGAFEHRFQCRLDIIEFFSQVFSGLPHSFVCLLFGVGDSYVENDEELSDVNGVLPRCCGEERVCCC